MAIRFDAVESAQLRLEPREHGLAAIATAAVADEWERCELPLERTCGFSLEDEPYA